MKVTEAPHYRRHVAQREMKEAGAASARPDGLAAMPARLTRSEGPGHTVGPRAARRQLRQRLPVRLAHGRDLAERLPADPGRATCASMPLAEAYRETPLFRQLRTPSVLQGPLRPLRVPRHLRRLALARLRPHRRSVRDRPLVLVRAAREGLSSVDEVPVWTSSRGDARDPGAGSTPRGRTCSWARWRWPHRDSFSATRDHRHLRRPGRGECDERSQRRCASCSTIAAVEEIRSDELAGDYPAVQLCPRKATSGSTSSRVSERPSALPTSSPRSWRSSGVRIRVATPSHAGPDEDRARSAWSGHRRGTLEIRCTTPTSHRYRSSASRRSQSGSPLS